MQEQHLKKLINYDFEIDNDFDLGIEYFQEFSEKIAEELPKVPEGTSTPSGAQLERMQKFEKEYAYKHPNAKTREIRRAVQRKFNIHLLK